MKDKTLGIVLLVVAVILLGITFYINVSNSLGFLANPLVGEGLGLLCSSPEECRVFCHTNMGRCSNYCIKNPENKLCNTLFNNQR